MGMPAIHMDKWTTLRELEAPSVRLKEVALAADTALPLHAHDEYLVRLILDGSLRERVGSRSFDLTPSMVTCAHPDDAHEVRVHSRPLRYFSVEFAPLWTERLHAYSIAAPRSRRIEDDEVIASTIRLFRELAAPDDVSPLAVEGIAFELMVALGRSGTHASRPHAPGWLRQATDVLRERFQSPPTLSQLAASVDVHPGHLTRAFRAHYGCSVGEYVRMLRVEYARDRLARTDAPLADVAAGAGFSDQSHFSRVFKRTTGRTPASYRSEIRS